jgi:aminoglycoside phosphotransferase (APT) family kinase protein
VPEQKGTSLVHGDYNLANLILDRDGAVLAVLDWELCTLGDPVADLGTLLCYWPDTPDQAVLERDPVQLLPGFAGRDDVIAAYAAAAPERDLSDLGFWTALATWRLGVILEGVTRRRMQHSTNSGTSPDRLRDAADRLFETAAALADVG